MPYALHVAGRTSHALPINDKWADANILGGQRQLPQEIYRQGSEACHLFKAEAESVGGRILSHPLHPAVSGQPFRIASVERRLAKSAAGGCRSAAGRQIVSAFQKQVPAA